MLWGIVLIFPVSALRQCSLTLIPSNPENLLPTTIDKSIIIWVNFSILVWRALVKYIPFFCCKIRKANGGCEPTIHNNRLHRQRRTDSVCSSIWLQLEMSIVNRDWAAMNKYSLWEYLLVWSSADPITQALQQLENSGLHLSCIIMQDENVNHMIHSCTLNYTEHLQTVTHCVAVDQIFLCLSRSSWWQSKVLYFEVTFKHCNQVGNV